MITFIKNLNSIIFVICAFVLSACSPYKVPTEALNLPPDGDILKNKTQALNNRLYHIVPRHRCQIRWYDLPHWGTWMLFGNDDDGIFGEGLNAQYRLDEQNTLGKACAWWFRNPFHNFCFYVIGTAYTENSEVSILRITPRRVSGMTYRKHPTTEFPSNGACFNMALHGWKPFVSFRLAYPNRKTSDFYIGWRCRGNFGIKCVLLTTPKN